MKLASTVAVLVVLLMVPVTSPAVPNLWTGGATGDWGSGGNWSAGIPQAGHEVVITNAGVSVLLTNSTPLLASLVISNNASLVFTNWNTTLNATDVTVGSGGKLTCAGPFANGEMSNNVYIVCGNLTVRSGGSMDVNGRGFVGGNKDVLGTGGVLGAGHGTGGGGAILAYGSGGGHGGRGGQAGTATGTAGQLGGSPYGSAAAPVAPGSGAGSCRHTTHDYRGGDGGGAIRIEVTGACRIDGAITADGTYQSIHGGTGSGGSVYITCGTLRGSGDVSAASVDGSTHGVGGGAGGRVAIVVTDEALQATLPIPGIRFSVMRGRSTYLADGELGTLHFSNTNLIDWSYIPHSGRFASPVPNPWSVDSLTISNGYIQILSNQFTLAVNNDMNVIGTNGILQLATNNAFSVGRDLTLRDGATLHLYGHASQVSTYSVGRTLMLTNRVGVTTPARLCVAASTDIVPAPTCAVSVVVGGDIVLSDNAWVYPASHPTNGGSVYFHAANFAVYGASAGFNANERGHCNSKGDGRGMGLGSPVSQWGGGGYGGLGGLGTQGGSGSTYGESNAPAQPGSGGALRALPVYAIAPTGRGYGGGLIWLNIGNRVTVNGTLMADGGNAYRGGGGSGGGIYIRCKAFEGADTAMLSANGGHYTASGGGPEDAGGGGGGRIAVWCRTDAYEGNFSRTGGTSAYPGGSNGAEGSLVRGLLPPTGTVIAIR